MTDTAPLSRYSRVAIALHWIIAALILANLYIGFAHEDWSRETRGFWMGQHLAFGLTILFLSVLRLLWRLFHDYPAPGENLAGWERLLARITHWLFYALLIGVPIGGWLIVSTWGGNPVNMFGLFEIPALPVARSESAHDFYEEMHELGAWAIVGLLALHVAGALKHQFFDRDGTLARMIPWLARTR